MDNMNVDEVIEHDLQQFLALYGYLDDSKSNVRGIKPSGHEQRSAIERYQKFYGLNATGTMNHATANHMLQPRCDVSDINVRAVRVGKWRKTKLTYKYLNFAVALSEEEVREGFAAACSVWSMHSPITFQEVVTGSADILIGFYKGRHGTSRYCDPGFTNKSNFAHAFFPPKSLGDSGIEGDIHFNNTTLWSVNVTSNEEEIDFVTVAAHELGHVLGLDHVGLSDALMHAHCKRPHRFLHEDDISGIQQLYGTPA